MSGSAAGTVCETLIQKSEVIRMYFVFSDVHGCHREMMKALQFWNPEREQLVVLGDLVDRGPDSMKVVSTLMNLKAAYGEQVVVLSGNHDKMFANWLVESARDDLAFGYMQTHDETLASTYEKHKHFKKASRQQRAENVLRNYKRELMFLYRLPHYHESEHVVFVHAGVNVKLDDWRTDTNCMDNVRARFYKSSYGVGKRVFFGHTPTALIRNDNSDHPDNTPWVNPDGDKVGVDGGACFSNGCLNALKVATDGTVVRTYAIKGDTVLSVTDGEPVRAAHPSVDWVTN